MHSKGQIQLVAVAALWLSLAGCSGSKKPPTEEILFDSETFTSDLSDFLTENPETNPILRSEAPEPAASFGVTVFVDQSQSIQAFVPSSPTPAFFESSNFVDLLRSLGHQAETSAFVGFGTGSAGEVRENHGRTPPLARQKYTLNNNDYATLISEFDQQAADKRIFVVVTDGVQSHTNASDGSLLGETAAAIKAWVSQGGYVDLRILTAPFEGKYFSEELRARGRPHTLYVSEAERPFLMMAFVPSFDLLDDWDDFLGRERLAELPWAATYRLPQFEEAVPPQVNPVAAKLNETESMALGLVPQTNRPYADFKHLRELDAPWKDCIWWSKIDSKALRRMDLTVIDQLSVHLNVSAYCIDPAGGTHGFDRDAFNSWKPRLQVYRESTTAEASANAGVEAHPSSGEPVAAPADSESVKKPVEIGSNPKKWELIEDRDLRFDQYPIASVVLNESPASSGSPNTGVTHLPRAAPEERAGSDPNLEKEVRDSVPSLQLKIPWDSDSRTLVIFKHEPAEDMLERPDFSKWSTLDDSTKEEMKRVYNLQTLMEQITKDGQKITRPQGFALFLVPTRINRP